MDFSVNNMAEVVDSVDSDEMSFDEDARLFALSPSEPESSGEENVP